MNSEDVIKQNEMSWDKKVEDSSTPWSIPVTKDEIDKAREEIFNLKLTSDKDVPRDWLPKDLKNKKALCLACGGGQQGPILSAGGLDVVVFDLSSNQLKLDMQVAKENNLSLSTIQGDMRDLSVFEDESFDLVYCPVSVTYIPDVIPVFEEVYRVLKNKGSFLFGCVNPLIYLFDYQKYEEGIFEVVNSLPFNSLDELDEQGKIKFLENKESIEYSHTLESLIGGQTKVGFSIDGFYEDIDKDSVCKYTPKYFATKATKNL